MRVSRIIYYFLFNICLISYVPIAEAASCEASFNTSAAPNVLMFSTWIESQSLNARDAIMQVHQLAEKEGFVVAKKKKKTAKWSWIFFKRRLARLVVFSWLPLQMRI